MDQKNEISMDVSNPLQDFFQRINFRKGRDSAINATGLKLAVIIWSVVVNNKPYFNPNEYFFPQSKKKIKIS
ncbi:MAG: hypothetical protein ACM3PT_01160 [Deltaproteobacteria bacterium]